MTQTPSSDPTPDQAQQNPDENQPMQSQPGTETVVGTDEEPDVDPDEVEH